jgi:hypothetical protein
MAGSCGPNIEENPALVRRNWIFSAHGHLNPGALISHQVCRISGILSFELEIAIEISLSKTRSPFWRFGSLV